MVAGIDENTYNSAGQLTRRCGGEYDPDSYDGAGNVVGQEERAPGRRRNPRATRTTRRGN